MAFKADHLETTGIQVSPVWGMTFDIAQHRFYLKALLTGKVLKRQAGMPVCWLNLNYSLMSVITGNMTINSMQVSSIHTGTINLDLMV